MRFVRRWRVLALVVTTLALALVTAAPIGAHPDHGNEHLPPGATNAMRAFHANRPGAQNLAAQAATPCVNGFAGQYPCNNVDLEAFLPLNQIGATSSQDEANDIWGWTDPVTGDEIAIIGTVFGTSFIDVTVPDSPVFLGELPTHGAFGSSWRDIKTYADHAFIVSEASNHGMQVFDLTQLRNVTNPPVTFAETKHYKKNAQAHNIVINEDSGFAYLVGTTGRNNCNGGLHVVDISNPTNPRFEGCYSGDGYTHDAQCVNYAGPDPDHQGKEICLNSNEDTLTIVDVTNKSNIVQLSRTGYPGAQYTHQGWLTEDSAYFLIDDELDETNLGHNTRTRVFDVSNLDAPVLVGSYDSNNPAIDHNQYVKGNFSYQSNYRSGLRILDISQLATANLSEVGFFDVWPADDATGFNGTWSNYPYFASGIVVVSGIEQGLFVLRPNLGPQDNPPSVTMTDPADGATVSGNAVLVAADASDDNGVTQVEFFVDGNSIGVDTSAPYSVDWDSTTVPDGLVAVSATATDTIGQTASDSHNVTVDNVADPTIHVGDLDGASADAGRGGKWNATVTITVHDSGHATVDGATVDGSWSNGANGSGSCLTNGSGQCSITKNNINKNSSSATFTVTGVSHATFAYASGDNHDPDGDSDGTTMVIAKP